MENKKKLNVTDKLMHHLSPSNKFEDSAPLNFQLTVREHTDILTLLKDKIVCTQYSLKRNFNRILLDATGIDTQFKSRPRIHLSSDRPSLGDTISLQVVVPRPRTFVGHVHNFFREYFGDGLVSIHYNDEKLLTHLKRDGVRRVFIPTTPLCAPGTYSLQVQVRDGRHEDLQLKVQLLNRDFPTEKLWFDKDHIKGDLGIGEFEQSQIRTGTQSRSRRQLWTGAFLRPCIGEETAGYGTRRYYNGRWAEGYFHEGLDFGAREGALVTAPAAGVVKMVGREQDGFNVYGNCIAVDHGAGVVSLMLHLSSILITPGERVEVGAPIAHVGDTGRSTAPHLHWGLYVGGRAVDPTPWMDQRPTAPKSKHIWS
mmetsp:Transcript_1726/g.2462  ORF Transcript_1726/g.2462 Transcript_1726/m.2462 type:complete len:368 (-) Transcript_1726:130-1233(-)